MARTADLQGLRTRFKNEIESLLFFYLHAFAAISKQRTKSTPAEKQGYHKDRTLLAEVVFHRGYVAVERFLSDWYVGCINKDPAKFAEKHKNKVEDSINKIAATASKDFLEYTIKQPGSLTVESIRQCVCCNGWNVTFANFADLKKKAGKYLSDEWVKRVKSVTADRSGVLNAARLIRNCIAHNSDASRESMNKAIRSIGCVPLKLGRKDRSKGAVQKEGSGTKRSAGPYLNAQTTSPDGGEASRLEVFFWHFKGLADDLTGSSELVASVGA